MERDAEATVKEMEMFSDVEKQGRPSLESATKFTSFFIDHKDPGSSRILKDLDKDGDGRVSMDELTNYIEKHRDTKRDRKMLRMLLISSVILMVLLVGSLTAMTVVVVDRAKDTEVQGNAIKVRGTSTTAQCASADLKVTSDGVIVAQSSDHSRKLLARDNADIATALAVRNHYVSVELSSTLPDEYFQELHWFKIFSSTGLQMSFKVLAMSRVLTKSAKCGTLLKIVTAAGVIILDDKDIYYSDDMFGLFQESGFTLFSATIGTSQAGFKSIRGRRLESSKPGISFTIQGFFNSISSYDWTCASVEKPSLSSTYSISTRTLSPCDSDPSPCYFESFGSRVVEQYGVVEVNEISYMETLRENFIHSDSSHAVTYLKYRPGVKLVNSIYLANSVNGTVAYNYQIEDDGNYSHCSIRDFPADVRMTLPDDYIFYPLDNTGPNNDLMHFRISYQPEIPEYIRTSLSVLAPIAADLWVHLDYFEDRVTKEPKLLLVGNDIIEMSNYKPGDSMSSVENIDEIRFKKCMLVSETFRTNKLESYQANFTSASFKDTISAIEAIPKVRRPKNDSILLELYHAWDWTLPAYPPTDTGPIYFSHEDFKYYLGRKSDAAWRKWAFENYDNAVPDTPSTKFLYMDDNDMNIFYGSSSTIKSSAIKSSVVQVGTKPKFWDKAPIGVSRQGRSQPLTRHQDHRSLTVMPEFELSMTGGTEIEVSAGFPVGEVVDFSLALGVDLSSGVIITGSASGCVMVIMCLEGSISVNIAQATAPGAPFPVSSSITSVVDLNNLLPAPIKMKSNALRYVLGYIKYTPIRGASNVAITPANINTGYSVFITQYPHKHQIIASLTIPVPPPLNAFVRGSIGAEASFFEKYNTGVYCKKPSDATHYDCNDAAYKNAACGDPHVHPHAYYNYMFGYGRKTGAGSAQAKNKCQTDVGAFKFGKVRVATTAVLQMYLRYGYYDFWTNVVSPSWKDSQLTYFQRSWSLTKDN